MVSLIYRLLSFVVFGLGWPFWWLQPRLRAGQRQRWGLYGPRRPVWPRGPSPRIWLHGASAGDVRALRPLVAHIRAAMPSATLVLSTITDTGYQMAERELSKWVDGIVYAPLDTSGATRRTVGVLRPDLLVLEYAELWPNLIAAVKASGARVVLVNGRIHPDKLTAYRWLMWLAGSPVRAFDRLLMRSDADAARIRALGAVDDRVEVTGNTKFDDVVAPEPSPGFDILGPGPWLVAGSTHVEDETKVLAGFAALKQVDPAARLIVAPRYPERASSVAADIERTWSVARWPLVGGYDPSTSDVVVVGAVGFLRAMYLIARVAVVGGTFGRRGGHNILEPAAAGVPTLAGLDLRNSPDAVELLRGRGLIQVGDASTLSRVLIDLWTDDLLRTRLGQRAVTAVNTARGATRRNAEVVIELLLADDSSHNPEPTTAQEPPDLDRLRRAPG